MGSTPAPRAQTARLASRGAGRSSARIGGRPQAGGKGRSGSARRLHAGRPGEGGGLFAGTVEVRAGPVLQFDSYLHRNAPLSHMKRVPGYTIPMVPMHLAPMAPMNLVEQIRAL
jgi:hypothetical protein